MSTLQKVAFRAGCSVATASRVMNRNGPVSDEMVRRVRRAAAELGYRAGSRGGSRPAIGVLIPSITNPVFAASLSSIQNRALHAGHSVLIAQSNYDPAQEADAVASLLQQQPTGLILTLCDPERSLLLSSALPPTVLLGNLPTARFTAAVATDNFGAGRDLTEHLLCKGHRRILFISGHFSASDRARLRYLGYVRAMETARQQPLDALEISFVNSLEQLDLSDAVSRFGPTAIIASNDLLALGVMGALRRQGLSIPRDISVAGFDGISLGFLGEVPLTTVEIPDGTMGAAAASLLLDMAENAAPPRHLTVPYRMRAGGTVRNLATQS
ncbi:MULTISPECIES: substrate-binding domain-containing protein [unclassified Rhizobium]|jgi:DNA-binding LacI/PurR family transcriptional regulator|uniref:substrate-binding domain-containing protein n=1 Tax=unclassified Rhizobium TaxID=2613769 RepID=UPI0006475E4B|nr:MULTISPECIES: substrate-binding domain-containing protein [unclassified Rhizobium]MBN8954697.1 substrate-binding domain-containing protein [Rhizobium tropici]OJY75475.1 MAG: transcriptional regulator [Rhizobium sp. 60-20]RKD70503.1 LacI family transcriptional regulator [Rhizobium sp. WW_1]